MTVSKKQQGHVNRYVKEHYDQIIVRLKKGSREKLRQLAERSGVSVNEYIRRAILTKAENDGTNIEL